MKQEDTILIANDERINILVLNTGLKDEYELVVARDGREALDYAASAVALDDGQEVSITCSIGVSQWHENETELSLIHRADQALYSAKEHGRNRVGTSAA